MAHVLGERVKETTTTTGTGTLALAGAVSQFQAFSDVMVNNDTTVYAIVGQTGTEWEVGLGTWLTGNSLARTTVYDSSNAGSLVTLSAGTKDVFTTARVPAASDTEAGTIELAVQSEMETGTDTTRAVVPGRQHFHPSAAKFWVQWTGNSTTILSSYNMTSIADTAVGDADGTIATDFSGVNWCGQVTTLDSTANGWDANSIQSSGLNARAAGTFGVLCGFIIDGGTAVAGLVDPVSWNVAGFGDQA